MMRKTRNQKSNEPSTLSCASKDLISDLPDAILEHIISLLDAKDAVKTSVLSKRWESLWTSTSSLLFYCPNRLYEQEENILSFATFVDNTLMRHSSPKINKFLLQCHGTFIPEDQVESWLQFAGNHKVEELCLELYFMCDDDYEWQGALASCRRKWWLMDVLEGFFGKSVKVLSLTSTTLESDKIRSILLGSPFLECLRLQNCQLYDNVLVIDENERNAFPAIFDASHTSLKELVLDNHWTLYYTQEISISAPNLLSLTIAGCSSDVKFKLVDFSSLVEANVDFLTYDDDEKKILKDLVQNLRHVNKLTVGIRCSQEDGTVRKAIIARFPTATRKVLEIDMESTKGYFCELSSLLCNLHDLEELTINLMPPDYHEFKQVNIRWKHEIQDRVEPFPMWHLKSITITGFAAGSSSSSYIVLAKMAKYLLANAKVLQKLTVCAKPVSLSSAKQKAVRRLFEIMQKYPRASPEAVVLFESNLL